MAAAAWPPPQSRATARGCPRACRHQAAKRASRAPTRCRRCGTSRSSPPASSRAGPSRGVAYTATAHRMKLSSTARAVALATLAYSVLTIAYSWPLPMRMHDIAHDAGDPVLNAWILWWTTQAVPLTAAWWNAPIFYPAPGTFAFSEHLLGQAPIAAPLIALTGSPLFGYNAMLLATYVLSGLGGYFLAYTLTRRHDASFVAGLAFAFAPYRVAQLPHIQVLTSFWTPVCLAALHRYDREPSTRWAALAAGAWLMQSLSNGYYMFFLSVLLALWFAWFAIGRWPLAQ